LWAGKHGLLLVAMDDAAGNYMMADGRCSRWIIAAALLVWLLVTFCAPALGVFGMPGEWYAGLAKPSWNPPSWVFGPVWSVLYTLMAVAAWLVWCRGGWQAQHRPLTLYLIQLALNAVWTPLFFGFQRPGIALVDIMLLFIAIAATLRAFLRVRPVAGWLLVPYLIWVGFATVLNFTLWWMNRG
jgi:tryptophan-rich sensory protein